MRILLRVALLYATLLAGVGADTITCVDANPLKCHQTTVIREQSEPFHPQSGFRRSRVFGAQNRRFRTPNAVGQPIPRVQSLNVQNAVPTQVVTSSSAVAQANLFSANTRTSISTVLPPTRPSTTEVTTTTPTTTTTRTTTTETTTTSTTTFSTTATTALTTLKESEAVTEATEGTDGPKAFGPRLSDTGPVKDSKFSSDKLLVGPVGGGNAADPLYLNKKNPNGGLTSNAQGLPDGGRHKLPPGQTSHGHGQGREALPPAPPPRGLATARDQLPLDEHGEHFEEGHDEEHHDSDSYNEPSSESPKPSRGGYDEPATPSKPSRGGYDESEAPKPSRGGYDEPATPAKPSRGGYDEPAPPPKPSRSGYDEPAPKRGGYDERPRPPPAPEEDADPGYGPVAPRRPIDDSGYGPYGTGRSKPGYYARPGVGDAGYSGVGGPGGGAGPSSAFNQAEQKKKPEPEKEKTASEELAEIKAKEEQHAERNKVDPSAIGEKSRFSTHSIRTGPRGQNAKLVSAKYFYPPKKDLPLPKCFYNGDGYVCCSLDLNELMVNVYNKLKSDPHFHTCNIGAVTSAMQRHAEEKFDTPFEAITGFEDYAQRIHFSGDLVCKIEIDGKFILTYATPYNAEEAYDPNEDAKDKLPADLATPLANKTGPVIPRFRRALPTSTILIGPKSRK